MLNHKIYFVLTAVNIRTETLFLARVIGLNNSRGRGLIVTQKGAILSVLRKSIVDV